LGGEEGLVKRPKVPLIWHITAGAVRFPFYAVARRIYQGAVHFPPVGTGYIVAVNHITNLDWLPVAESLYLRGTPPTVLAKASLFRIPVIGAILSRLGLIPVERGTDRAADALAAAKEVLEAGRVVIFFPEGTLTADPDLWPMTPRAGVGRLAISTGVPVIPMAIWGTQEILPPSTGRPRLFGRRKPVYLRVGPQVDLADLVGRSDDPTAGREATNRIMTRVAALVGELRGETPPPTFFPRPEN